MVIELITHSRSWVLLEKLPSVQPLKKFSTFYGTLGFITVFTRALSTGPHPEPDQAYRFVKTLCFPNVSLKYFSNNKRRMKNREQRRVTWLTLVTHNMRLPFMLRTRERETSLPDIATFLPLINSSLQLSTTWVTLLEHKVPHTSECFFPFLEVGYIVPWTVNKTFFPASWAAWILVLYFLPVCCSFYGNNH
jgi:hypothetical protein